MDNDLRAGIATAAIINTVSHDRAIAWMPQDDVTARVKNLVFDALSLDPSEAAAAARVRAHINGDGSLAYRNFERRDEAFNHDVRILLERFK